MATPREIITWGLTLGMLFFVGFNHFLAPSFKKTDEAQAKIQFEQIQLKAHQNFGKSKKINKSGLSNTNRKAIQDKVKRALTNSAMSSDVIISQIMTELTGPRYSQLAWMKSFTVKEEKDEKGFTEIKFDIILIGKYLDIARYLKSMRALPYLISTQGIQVKPFLIDNSDKVLVVANNVLYVSKNSKSKPFNKPTDLIRGELGTKKEERQNLDSNSEFQAPFASKARGARAWSVNELDLTGIISGGFKPTALINGRVFELGDEIAGFRIADIRPQEIVLKSNFRQHILKIKEMRSGSLEVVGENERIRQREEKMKKLAALEGDEEKPFLAEEAEFKDRKIRKQRRRREFIPDSEIAMDMEEDNEFLEDEGYRYPDDRDLDETTFLNEENEWPPEA